MHHVTPCDRNRLKKEAAPGVPRPRAVSGLRETNATDMVEQGNREVARPVFRSALHLAGCNPSFPPVAVGRPSTLRWGAVLLAVPVVPTCARGYARAW